MARLITTDVALARKGIDRIVELYQKERPTHYTRLIGKMMNSTQAFERFKAMSGFPETVVVPEGTDIPVADFETPFQRDFTVISRGIGYEVTAQARYTDLYNVIKKPTQLMMDALYDSREQSAANLLNLGFTAPGSGGTWTVDNVALFSASHPLKAGVAGNTAALALGILNLETAVQAAGKTQDYMGKVWQGPKRWMLVVPTELDILAHRLVQSIALPTTNDNDKNVVGSRLEVVVNPYLTDTNNWALIPAEERYNPLFRITRQSLTAIEDKLVRRPGDMFFGRWEEYGDGAEDWRGTFGCNPS